MMVRNDIPPGFVQFLRDKLPPWETLVAMTDVKDMGPNVTLPAIHVHVALLRIEALEAELLLARAEILTGEKPRTPPSNVITFPGKAP